MKCEAPTALTVRAVHVWYLRLCSLVDIYQCFEGSVFLQNVEIYQSV
jgi:hypothetical protein